MHIYIVLVSLLLDYSPLAEGRKVNQDRSSGQMKSECRPNEEWLVCGTSCPLTCANRNDPPDACTENCVQGCFCKEHLLRHKEGRCVLAENCDKELSVSKISQPKYRCRGINEIYNKCGGCPKTCADLDREPMMCTMQCRSGCECLPGYLRDRKRNCVRPKDCDNDRK